MYRAPSGSTFPLSNHHTVSRRRSRIALALPSLALVVAWGCGAGSERSEAPAPEKNPSNSASKTAQTAQAVHPARVSAIPDFDGDRTLRTAFIRAQQDGAAAEYRVVAERGQNLAHNLTHALDVRYGRDRLVLARTDASNDRGAFEETLAFAGVGRSEELEAPPVTAVHTSGTRVEYERTGLTEWYVNGPLGVEQGFTVRAAPPGSGRVQLAMTVEGGLDPVLIEDGTVDLRDASDQTALTISDLVVTDADGVELPSSFAVRGRRIAVTFDDSSARYPVQVDPLIASLKSALTASDSGTNSLFGYSVAMDGTTAVIGAPNQDSQAGAAYVFTKASSGKWSQRAKLTRNDPTQVILPLDPPVQFGFSVAISGNTIAVGSTHATDARLGGEVHVFTGSGATWTFQQSLLGRNHLDADLFGTSLALSGDRLAVGAPDADPPLGLKNEGEVSVFTRSNGKWSVEAHVGPYQGASGFPSDFGQSVALMGETLLVGTPASTDRDLNGLSAAGRGYVWQHSSSNGWTLEAVLLSPSPIAGGSFGASVSLAGVTSSSNGTALLMEPGSNPKGTRSGSGHVFTRSGTTWTRQTTLVPSTAATSSTYLIGALSIQTVDGVSRTTAALGAPSFGYPVVLFTRSSSGTWSEQSTVQNPDATGNAPRWGEALAIDYKSLIVGNDWANSAAGEAYFFNVGLKNGDSCSKASQCVSGFCVDGVCCNTTCGAGASDCQACSKAQGAPANGTCAFLPSTTTCRAAAGSCDQAEACTGSSGSCPSDAKKASGTTCRAAAGTCDVAETCNGTSTSCPSDAKKASGTSCRAAAGVCDVAETCNGTSAGCPSDAKKAAGTSCRASAGLCDPAESCDGSSAACPADALLPLGTLCGTSPLCQVLCTGVDPDCGCP